MRNATKVVSGAISMLLLVGCGDGQGGSSVDAQAELEKRRTYAQAKADNLGLLSEVRTALSGVVPQLEWLTPEPLLDGESGCVEPQFESISGASHATFDSGGAKGAIGDAEWPKAWAAVQEVAAKQGFGKPNVLIDQPGHHVVSLYDEDGAELSINTKVNTAVSLYGACHLK